MVVLSPHVETFFFFMNIFSYKFFELMTVIFLKVLLRMGLEQTPGLGYLDKSEVSWESDQETWLQET